MSHEVEHRRSEAQRLRQEHRLDEAVAACRSALQTAPGDAQIWSELAHALRWQGKFAEAREAAHTAARLAPELAVAWFNLGAALAGQGELAEAVAAYRKALALQPAFAEAWSNLGNVLGAQGDMAGQTAAYRQALDANPGLAPVWSNLGGALRKAGEIEEAVTACRRAVALDPGLTAGWTNLAYALCDSGLATEGVEAGGRATQLAPAVAPTWSALGNSLLKSGRFEEGLSAYRKALECEPDNAGMHFNVGVALRHLGRSAESVACYRRALALAPDDAETHWNLSLALLTVGELREGWDEYEWRWRRRESEPVRHAFTPWNGDLSAARRVLLWAEQGVGDQIIYASMVGDLASAPLRVALEADSRLVPLIARSFPGVSVLARQDPPAEHAADYDVQAPLASLGRFLRPSLESFPRHAGYFVPDRSRVAAYRARLPGAALVVGLSWRSANAEIGQFKSVTLSGALQFLKTPGVAFVDLQYGDTALERGALESEHGVRIEHLPDLDLFNDLDGLAALCAACDLVISVSNVTAHLAGAIGRPIWLLAPRARGKIWYWFSGRRDSPWYPSMRVFEQTGPGHWEPVLAEVAQELALLAAGRLEGRVSHG